MSTYQYGKTHVLHRKDNRNYLVTLVFDVDVKTNTVQILETTVAELDTIQNPAKTEDDTSYVPNYCF